MSYRLFVVWQLQLTVCNTVCQDDCQTPTVLINSSSLALYCHSPLPLAKASCQADKYLKQGRFTQKLSLSRPLQYSQIASAGNFLEWVWVSYKEMWFHIFKNLNDRICNHFTACSALFSYITANQLTIRTLVFKRCNGLFTFGRASVNDANKYTVQNVSN